MQLKTLKSKVPEYLKNYNQLRQYSKYLEDETHLSWVNFQTRFHWLKAKQLTVKHHKVPVYTKLINDILNDFEKCLIRVRRVKKYLKKGSPEKSIQNLIYVIKILSRMNYNINSANLIYSEIYSDSNEVIKNKDLEIHNDLKKYTLDMMEVLENMKIKIKTLLIFKMKDYE